MDFEITMRNRGMYNIYFSILLYFTVFVCVIYYNQEHKPATYFEKGF